MKRHHSRFAARTDPGVKRSQNEDAIGISEHSGLWLVADGMGGHGSGEVASLVAKDRMLSAFDAGAGLTEVVQQGHAAVVEAARAGQGSPNMGTTVVALRNVGTHYEVAWVGDSRAYLWDGKLRRLTKDHSVQQEMLDHTGADPDDLPPGARSKRITRCLGPPNPGFPRVDTRKGVWRESEAMLLCSDGLSDELTDAQIAEIITAHLGEGEQAVVEALVDAARTAGGRDNISVVLVAAPDDIRQRQRRQRLLRALARPALSLGLGMLFAFLAAWVAYLYLA